MFKLTRQCHLNAQKMLARAPESLLVNCKYRLNKLVKNDRIDGFKTTQIRYKSNNPPPRMIDMKPEGIPYVRPELRPSRGRILLAIPFVTFALGTWQVKRLKWKTELIKTIEERTAMDPIPLPTDLGDVADLEFRRVIVKGTFDHDTEFTYGPKPCVVDGEFSSTSSEGSFGYNLVTPFVLSDTGERILVNRGWIRTKTVHPTKRPWSRTEGEQTITGVVRESEAISAIAPSRHDKYNVWHYRDIKDMAEKKNCLPIYIDATVNHSIPNYLWAGQTRIQLRNEHLTYIITWYSLSIATFFLWYKKYGKK